MRDEQGAMTYSQTGSMVYIAPAHGSRQQGRNLPLGREVVPKGCVEAANIMRKGSWSIM